MLSWSDWNNNYQVECEQGYSEFKNKITRRKMYKDYVTRQVKEQEVNTINIPTINTSCGVASYYVNSLAPMPTVCTAECPPPQKKGWSFSNQEQGNNPMNYASASISTPATETQDQRKYLTSRLQDVYSSKREPLEAMFGLIDDDAPTTPEEMSKRIADGKFIIRGLDGKGPRYFYWTEALQWRDPSKKADQDGFEAARTALRNEKQKVLDIIKIDEPKAGLEAIKALEAWTPTGASN